MVLFDNEYVTLSLDEAVPCVEWIGKKYMEIAISGKRHLVNANQEQILLLLVSAYQAAVNCNEDLTQTQDELRSLNEHLEDLVRERTEELSSEIAERERAQIALRESEERYRRITEGLSDYFYTVQVKDGLATETSHHPACEAVTGYAAREFSLDPGLWIKMIPEQERKQVIEHAAAILSGKDASVIEHHIARKDGKIRWVSDTPIPKFDASGAMVSYDGVIKDITERKQAEEKVQALNAELERRVVERTAQLQKANESLEIAKSTAEQASRTKSDFLANMKQQGLRAIEEKQSPYKVLEEDCNIEIHSTEDTIQAIKASKVQAEILHVGQNDPLLFIERLAYSKGGEIDTSTPSR